MHYQKIIFEMQDQIAWVTLNCPQTRNALTSKEMIQEIESACTQANQDKNVNCFVITSKDPAFSSGGNIKDMQKKSGMFAGSPAEIMQSYRENVQRIPRAIFNLQMPVIAAVNGPAIGAGCDLALMCDIRIASTKASFAESFINVGLIPGDAGSYFLPKLVGPAQAAEMTFTGTTITAEKALQIGLTNHLVEHEKLISKTKELAKKISQKPSQALRMSKSLLRLSHRSDLEQILEQSAAMQALCHCSEDHLEALNSLFEKRDPEFKGK